MTHEECQKLYNGICADYGKAVNVAEFSVFEKHVCKLNKRQWELVYKRVKSFLNDTMKMSSGHHLI